MRDPLASYFLRIELFLLVCSLIAGGAFWLNHGQVAGIRMAIGTLVLSNVLMAWSLRSALRQLIRNMLSKPAEQAGKSDRNGR